MRRVDVAAILFALWSCAENQPPIEHPNPQAADCIADRGAAELNCVKTSSTRADADACIERVKAQRDCTDGGK